MGLKQSVVIVNEYTIRTGDGKGTRGGSPGNFIIGYMLRKGATEDLTPVRLEDTDKYVTRYMARKSATETLHSVPEIKKGMRAAQRLGGIAFGNSDVSMSDAKVRSVSRDIQRQFDKGKTVLKTVVSFDTDYLKEHGIVRPDFELEKEGDLRGNIDQMKMRLAIMNGMSKLGRSFDDLEWVGVLQVDTKHLHCHLCMVDKGRGYIMPDGTQRGKLNENHKRDLRRGIDLQLNEMHPVKMMSSNITHDRRNTKCFIKKFTHDTMSKNGTPQFLLACLPDDKRLWRASTNRKEMRKANTIVKEYVEQVLQQPDSGYQDALRDIHDYASYRQKQEDLSAKEYRKLIDNGQERLMQDCMNGVYAVLKQIPERERAVRTPMLDVMSMDYVDMASETQTDPMMEFGFKLRSYSSRLSHHKKERHKYKAAKENYEEAAKSSDVGVSEDSKPLYDFYKAEEEYNAMLMCKYQHFLSFLPPEDDYQQDFKELMDYKDRMRRLRLMRDDNAMNRLNEEKAEAYGRDVYDMHGGRYAVSAPQVLERRQVLMQQTYDKMESNFKVKLSDYGMTLETTQAGTTAVSRTKPYPFDDVKALDMHHLMYDFPYDVNVSKRNVDNFLEITQERYTKFQGACEYLKESGQDEFIKELPVNDITMMKDLADRLQSVGGVLPTRKGSATGRKHGARTVRLDVDYNPDLKLAVQSVVQTAQLGE